MDGDGVRGRRCRVVGTECRRCGRYEVMGGDGGGREPMTGGGDGSRRESRGTRRGARRRVRRTEGQRATNAARDDQRGGGHDPGSTHTGAPVTSRLLGRTGKLQPHAVGGRRERRAPAPDAGAVVVGHRLAPTYFDLGRFPGRRGGRRHAPRRHGRFTLERDVVERRRRRTAPARRRSCRARRGLRGLRGGAVTRWPRRTAR